MGAEAVWPIAAATEEGERLQRPLNGVSFTGHQPSCNPARVSGLPGFHAVSEIVRAFPNRESLHQRLGQLLIEFNDTLKSQLWDTQVWPHIANPKCFLLLLIYYCVINIILIDHRTHDELLMR